MLPKNTKKSITISIIVVVCVMIGVILLVNLKNKLPQETAQLPEITTAPTDEANPETTENNIEPLPEKDFYTMEDFSSLVKNESPYSDVCKLIPEERQPERTVVSDKYSYSKYPTEDGGYIQIYFQEDVVTGIIFCPRDQSEYYPVKDVSVFSFIVPGETTLIEVMEAVPSPNHGVLATSQMLSWLDYDVADGSTVRIYFYQTGELKNVIHSVEVIKNENAQRPNGYPLVFADISDEKRKITVFAYIRDGKLITTDEFTYSGKPLSAYMETPADVTSDILPEGTEFLFMNDDWDSFRANSTGLRCESNGMMYEDIYVYSTVDQYRYGKEYYFGAPSWVALYPNSIIRHADGFSTDLNKDDRMDQVTWTFTESEEEDLFHYRVKVMLGDRELTVVKEGDYPCAKEDLAIWPVDLEQDGIFELVVYEKTYRTFGDLRIYKLNGDAYEEAFWFVFEQMP